MPDFMLLNMAFGVDPCTHFSLINLGAEFPSSLPPWQPAQYVLYITSACWLYTFVANRKKIIPDANTSFMKVQITLFLPTRLITKDMALGFQDKTDKKSFCSV